MNKLAKKARMTAVSLVKRGCSKELTELLVGDELSELVTVRTLVDVPCKLVRDFTDSRSRYDSKDDDEDYAGKETLRAESDHNSESYICSCISYSEKDDVSTNRHRLHGRKEVKAHHRGTLLELATAYGKPDVVKALLEVGANPYGIHDGTTALLQALLHWSHTHLLLDRNACLRYRRVVLMLLENIDCQKFSLLWDQRSTTKNNHKMKFHPINYTCSLGFPTGLETLLKAGFRVPVGDDSALSRVLCQFSKCCTHQLMESIDLLSQYGYTFNVALKSDHKLPMYLHNTLNRIIVCNQNPESLLKLLELGVDPNVTPQHITYLERLLSSYHDCKLNKKYPDRRIRSCRMSRQIPQDCVCRVKDVANILITANCNLQPRGDGKSQILCLAILRYQSLIFPLLKAGVQAYSEKRYFLTSSNVHGRIEGKNEIDLAEEHLSGELLDQFLAFVKNEDGIKTSLKFQCRIFIRNHLGLCTYPKLMKLGLPMQLVSYLMLNG